MHGFDLGLLMVSAPVGAHGPAHAYVTEWPVFVTEWAVVGMFFLLVKAVARSEPNVAGPVMLFAVVPARRRANRLHHAHGVFSGASPASESEVPQNTMPSW